MCQQDSNTATPVAVSQSHNHDITPEQASRLAVTALATDIEYWARESAQDGQVWLDDLTRMLDVVREASQPLPDLHPVNGLLTAISDWDHAQAS